MAPPGHSGPSKGWVRSHGTRESGRFLKVGLRDRFDLGPAYERVLRSLTRVGTTDWVPPSPMGSGFHKPWGRFF